MISTTSIRTGILKLWELLNRKEKFKCITMITLALSSSVFEVLTVSLVVIFAQTLTDPSLGTHYFSKVGIPEGLTPTKIIFYMALLFGSVYLLKNILAGIEVFYQNFTIQKMNAHFQRRLLERYAKRDYSFHLLRNASYGLSVLSADANHTFSTGMIAFSLVISEATVLLFLLSMIVYMNPSLAIWVFVVGGGIGWFIAKTVLPYFYSWGKISQEATIFSNQTLLQFFHGFKEIILLNKAKEFMEYYNFYYRKRTKVEAIKGAVNMLPRFVIEILFISFFVGVITFMCMTHNTPTQMMGTLGGYLYMGFRIMPGINKIIGQLNLFKASIPFIEKVHEEYCETSSQAYWADISDFKFTESIDIRNVSYRYLNTSRDVLKNINLSLKKGQSIGIIGETGSGKSTLLDLILGLLTPTSGEIRIDGKHPVACQQWHKLIGYVPQAIYLSDDTITANIAFGVSADQIDYSQLKKSVEEAQLNSLIDKLPEGVNTIVGERGVRLSGGERQRIAIARALYRNPEVLIFDEATSALDNETEEKLMATIYEISKNKTVLMIAHRLTSLKKCDSIIVLEKETIKEVKSFADVLTQSPEKKVKIHAR